MAHKTLLAAMAAALVVGRCSLSGQSAPQLPYENPGACPFECCTYRTWAVKTDTDLFVERRDNAPVATRVRRGQRVQGLTGVVVTTRLGRAAARKQATIGDQQVEPGEPIYILHYLGEGFWKYWFRGKVGEAFIPEQQNCLGRLRSRSECDIQILVKPETIWWTKVRARNGREGWTRQLEHFGNIDACG